MIEFVDIFTSSPETRKINDNLIQSLLFNNSAPKLEITLDADKEQQSFIDSKADTIRLIAPAGSGKTQSIVNRVLKRVAEGTSLRTFLVLTFDKSARDSLLDKFSDSITNLGLSRTSDPQVRTLNSFGREILKGFSPGLDEIANNEPNEIMRSILKDFKKENSG